MTRRLLIIDDCNVTTFVLRSGLERLGYEIQTAATGEDGLRALDGFNPDVVIVDRRLPNMAGEEVCDRLRADERTARSTIVMMTSTRDEALRASALAHGADDLFFKPLQPADVAERLERVVRGRAPATAPAPIGHPAAAPDVPRRLKGSAKALTSFLEILHESHGLTVKERGSLEAALALATQIASDADTLLNA